MFFLFAGKAYATFSLLFGFSFYIQFHNAEKRGTDFRGRFAWRMCLLFLFAQLHALFYNGDILLLYAVVGFALIPVCKLKDKTVFWIAAILLLQPYEWGRAIYAMINPEYVPSTGHFIPYYKLAQEVTSNGSFFEVLRSIKIPQNHPHRYCSRPHKTCIIPPKKAIKKQVSSTRTMNLIY